MNYNLLLLSILSDCPINLNLIWKNINKTQKGPGGFSDDSLICWFIIPTNLRSVFYLTPCLNLASLPSKIHFPDISFTLYPHENGEFNCCSLKASFVRQDLPDGRQPCQTAVACFKHKSCGDALQAKSLVMAFSELFSCHKCKWNSHLCLLTTVFQMAM